MKYITIFLIIITFLSCSKDEEELLAPVIPVVSSPAECIAATGVITYPATGLYGINILSLPDSTTILITDTFSFFATGSECAALRVVLFGQNSFGNPLWTPIINPGNGWGIADYDYLGNLQIFYGFALETTVQFRDVTMISSGEPGIMGVKMYENYQPTTMKYVIWQ